MENPKERIEDILKRNPYLDAKVGLGLHVADSFMLIRHISSANG